MITPARLPDAACIEIALTGLGPTSADAELVPTLTATFPDFEFSVSPIDDDYWRDACLVIRPTAMRRAT